MVTKMDFDIQNILTVVEMKDFINTYSAASSLANMVISLLCGILLLGYIKTETAKNKRSWTIYLGIVFIIFATQYFLALFEFFNLPDTLQENSILKNYFGVIVGQLFGFPLHLFLVITANIIRGKKIVNLSLIIFFIILLLDNLLIASGIYLGVDIKNSPDLFPTICRINYITLFCFWYFAYSVWESQGFFKQKSYQYIELFLLFLGIVFYGFLNFFLSIIPNVAHIIAPIYIGEDNVIETIIAFLQLTVALSAIPLKAILFIFAFRISSFEHNILIKLRDKLRESVNKRQTFFSSEGIIKSIYDIFQVAGVKLYIKIPTEKNNQISDKLHLFEYPAKGYSISDYEVINIEDTDFNSFLNDGKYTGNKEKPKFSGTKPIKYHGGLIGYLQLDNIHEQKFTFSPDRMVEILSEDISPVMQFYRLQESVNVLVKHLKVIGEKNVENTEKKLKAKFVSKSENEKNNQDILDIKKFKDDLNEGIQKILSPESVELNADFMFVIHHKSEKEHKTEGARKSYFCFVNNADVGFSIENVKATNDKFISGELTLQFEEGKDSLEKSSLGYYNTYGKSVSALVNETFLNCVEKKLGLVIKQLSVELAGRQTFNSWIEKIDKYARFALIDDVLVLHPQKRNYLENSPTSKGIIKKGLEQEFGKVEDVFKKLKDTHIPSVIMNTGEHLILGNKLKTERKEAFIIFAVNTKYFPKDAELKDIRFNKKWEKFFVNFADIAEKSLIRLIQAYEIEENQKELSEFENTLKIGLFTHEIVNILEDLNNPIFNLKEEINDLQIISIEKEKIEKSIRSIEVKFKDLRSLASGFRVVTNDQEVKGPGSLNEAIQNVIDDSKKTYDDRIKRITLTNNVGIKKDKNEKHDDIKINLSLRYLELIFSNLIRNSLRAINNTEELENSEIAVWTENNDLSNKVICYIADTGCGINYKDREKIFDAAYSSKKTGGGLGLFYIKKILKRYHGEIDLLEKPIKGNTTFKITLPKFKGENLQNVQ